MRWCVIPSLLSGSREVFGLMASDGVRLRVAHGLTVSRVLMSGSDTAAPVGVPARIAGLQVAGLVLSGRPIATTRNRFIPDVVPHGSASPSWVRTTGGGHYVSTPRWIPGTDSLVILEICRTAYMNSIRREQETSDSPHGMATS